MTNEMTRAERKTKLAMLAAASILASAAAIGPALATDYDQAAYPTIIEATVADDGAAAVQDDKQKPATRFAVIAAAAAALAGLVKLLGPKKVAEVVSKSAATAARTAGKAASGAASVVGKVAKGPMRWLAALFGLALFALTGVGVYDVEWLGGLLTGMAGATVAAYGYLKVRSQMALKPVRVRRKSDLGESNINQ